MYQAHKPRVLAHKWFHEFGTRHNMSIKAVRQRCDMRMLCRIAGAGSAKQSVGILSEGRQVGLREREARSNPMEGTYFIIKERRKKK